MATLRQTSRGRPGRGPSRILGINIVKIPENEPPPSDSETLLLRWNELDAWQKDNQYILAHYRPVTNSYIVSFQSLFYLHNESVNIHTHLLGASVFLFISFTLYAFGFHSVSAPDVWAFGCFFLGATLCLGTSATYHTISNHSPLVNQLGNQLDYAGIVALIVGSFIPSIYYGFYCNPLLQKSYWGMASPSYSVQILLAKSLNGNILDISYWVWLHHHVRDAQISHANVETFSSSDVCCNGYVGGVPSTPWSPAAWHRTDEQPDWPFLAGSPRLHLHIWCCDLRGLCSFIRLPGMNS